MHSQLYQALTELCARVKKECQTQENIYQVDNHIMYFLSISIILQGNNQGNNRTILMLVLIIQVLENTSQIHLC